MQFDLYVRDHPIDGKHMICEAESDSGARFAASVELPPIGPSMDFALIEAGYRIALAQIRHALCDQPDLLDIKVALDEFEAKVRA